MGRRAKPKGKAEARPPRARKVPTDQSAEVRDLKKRLVEALKREAEAREQQAATREILRVISSSPTDVQPVFDAIATSARRLCDGTHSAVLSYDGALIHLCSLDGVDPQSAEHLRRAFPMPPGRASTGARAILYREVVQIPDVLADSEYVLSSQAGTSGFRSVVAVPMLRDGAPIGSINVGRTAPGMFPDGQVALLQTFADQAVIAIENVRLFNETKEALERQTATSDILRTISSSPTDIQPVFDAIVESGMRLVDGDQCVLLGRQDGIATFLASHHNSPEAKAALLAILPRPVNRETTAGRAILDRCTVQIPDVLADPDYGLKHLTTVVGYRATIAVPMMREGDAIGAMTVSRKAPGEFSPRQIEILKTFADQAVIAIENVRLFEELESRNRDLTRALDRQTATAEVLRVISQSQTELQPVFDAIVEHAMRLFQAWAASLLRSDGQLVHLVAMRGGLPGSDQQVREQSPWSIHTSSPVTRCLASKTVVQVADVETDPALDEGIRELGRARGWRSILAAPMMRDGQPIGAIAVQREEARPFSAAEIELLRTFADQAVIAIENARLLGELRARTSELTRSVDQLTALGEVGQAVSSSLDLETVLTTIVSRAVQLSGLDGGTVFEYDETAEEFVQRATTGTARVLAGRAIVPKGEGVVGQTAVTFEPVEVPDIQVGGAYESRLREALLAAGVRAIIAVPIIREGRLLGGFAVNRNTPGEFPAETIELLRTFATQSALAIQNARLFHEIEGNSRQLEAASRHKSEFLANMSHELRTPLNAIIGFSEVVIQRMFGELNEKQDEYLKDIYASGQHLLSLINDILDLSKIEAGRMELEVADFDLPSAIDNALILVRERATRRGITLGHFVDERLGTIRGDERKVKQVLLNLLSNALKFTPEGGRIDVRATMNEYRAEISVTDTGVGIAPEDQKVIFEEFRQVGTADKKVEGTGLGLALSRKFIELHGGRIWVKSREGEGSTFTFTLPVDRRE